MTSRLSFMFGTLAAFTMATVANAATVNYETSTPGSISHGYENAPTNNYDSGEPNFNRATGTIAASPVEEFVIHNFGASVPAGQTIVSATLTLYAMQFAFIDSSEGGVDLPVYAAAALAGYDPPGTTNGTTWQNRDTGVPWAADGAKDGVLDFDATTEVITRVFPPVDNTPVPYTWDVTNLIQTQYDNNTLDLGILVGGRVASHWGSVSMAGWGEVQGVGTRPKLEIQYRAVPEPTTLALGFVSLLGLLALRRKR